MSTKRRMQPFSICKHTSAQRYMFYPMWTTQGQYCDPGMDYYEKKYQELILNKLEKKARNLGFQLVPTPVVQQLAPSSPTLAT
ncbi:MAG: hypothetical protein F6K36_23310 [Symploca sp. SIO3C6]|nr:hypothetical protein [Symploca sp. SIO3C6]